MNLEGHPINCLVNNYHSLSSETRPLIIENDHLNTKDSAALLLARSTFFGLARSFVFRCIIILALCRDREYFVSIFHIPFLHSMPAVEVECQELAWFPEYLNGGMV